jgi:ubiquinone/menaquinone biosynthesis C-methylase UbiE
MANLFQAVPLLIKQALGRQSALRVPEPEQLLNDPLQVADYKDIAVLPLILTYAISILYISKAWPEDQEPQHILDLASGPGHFSLTLAKVFSHSRVIGVDLADRMVAAAQAMALEQNYGDRCRFEKGSVTSLTSFPDASVDLSTSTNSAHHMPDMEMVRRMLTEMDRVTRPNGLVFLYDAARLKSEALIRSYVKMGGQAALDRGYKIFYEDFYNSMRAAWTTIDLASAVPRQTKRKWFHLVPFGLPASQIILGLPEASQHPFVHKHDLYRANDLIPALYHKEWQALKMDYALSKPKRLA